MSQETGNSSKKNPLDSLSREDLIKKCKGLLGLAQKAKQARDECAEENKKLNEKLSTYENQKEADKKAIVAMKEMVDSLTENKLELTTQVSDLKIWKLNIQKTLEEKDVDLCNLQIEKEALDRQVKRLSTENEELLADLTSMEKKLEQVTQFGIQQQKDLVILEKETEKWREYETISKNLQVRLDEISKENEELKIASQIEKEGQNTRNYEEVQAIIKDYENQIEQMKKLEKEQDQKIHTIKQKLITVATKLKNLKISKKVLLETLQDYAESVSNWQKDIFNASNQLCSRISNLENNKSLLEKDNEVLKSLSENLRRENDTLEGKLKNLEEEKRKLKNTIKNEKEQCHQSMSPVCEEKIVDVINCCEKILQEYDTGKDKLQENSKEDLDELKTRIDEQNETIKTLSLEKEKHLKEILNLQEDLKGKEAKLCQLQKNYEENCEKLEEIQERYNQQTIRLEVIENQLQNSGEENNKRIAELQEELNKQRELTVQQKEENSSLLDTINTQNAEVNRLQLSLSHRETEVSDLLLEMRELNEALKGRGDVISRQQEKIHELEIEMKRTSESLLNFEANLSKKDNLIAEKETEIDKMNQEINLAKDEVASLSHQAKENEKIIRDLSNEVTSMRDKIPSETQSEILSTSTYSRVDETARMKEVDESLEEKYGKLRSLAIKLKKKVQDQAEHIANLEKDNRKNFDEKNDITSKLGNISVQMKNLQALQSENDKLLDEVEKLREQTSKDENQIKKLKENIEELVLELNNKNGKSLDQDSGKKSLENAIREYQNQIKMLKQEKEAFNVIRKELEKESEKLKDALNVKDNEIETMKKQYEKIKIELEKKKATEKKSNVLNLEIEAYEKSLNEITKKLDARNSQIDDLTETVKVKELANQSLQEQIKLLEGNLESEKAHSQELKQQVDIQQAKYKENEYEKHELKMKIQDLTVECERLKSEVDELRLQISEIASEKDKLCVVLQNEKENLLRQVLKLEESLENEIDKSKRIERDLEDLRAEYASYKVKAQAVLRQNQTKESSRERELEEDITAMHSAIEALKLKIKNSEDQIESGERKMDDLRQDNERIQKRCKELIDLLEESRLQNDTLLEENREQSREYQELLKTHRLQIETLTNAYKKQIEDIEQKHLNEMEELKKCGVDAKESRLVSRIGPLGGPKTTDEQKIELILMEREDGEGSEASIPMPKRKVSSGRSKHDLIPLDELLNSSLDENQNDEEQRPVSPTIELQSARGKLHALENQIRHLTSLLAETEQDLAKLTQLNDLLKEEVRRHERTMEREQHMHNSEYIKNVVLKFLTLNSGDERIRLIPVLNTIFSLSPEETQTLQNVAKGGDIVNRGWGSYLPIWSNHQ